MILHSETSENFDQHITDIYNTCEHKEMEGIETVDDRVSDMSLEADDISPASSSGSSSSSYNSSHSSDSNNNSSFLRQILTGQGYQNDFLAMGEIMKVRQLMNNSFNTCLSSSTHHNEILTPSTLVPSQEQILDLRFTIQQVEKFKKVKYRSNVDIWNSFDRFGE